MDPKVISSTAQRFNGFVYRLSPGNRYFAKSKTRGYKGDCLLHREVWRVNNGEIPDGYHVHHKDNNPSNNALSNLEMLTCTEHLSGHMDDEYRKRIAAENLVKYAVPASKKWHSSEEGLEFHRRIGKMVWEKNEKVTLQCETCGKDFLVHAHVAKRTKYCHLNCKMAAYRKANPEKFRRYQREWWAKKKSSGSKKSETTGSTT